MLSEDIIEVSVDNFYPKNSPECTSELDNSEIQDKDIEYILEEIVSAEETSVSDLEVHAFAKEESNINHFDCPSEYEAIEPPSKVNTFYEQKCSEKETQNSVEIGFSSKLRKKRKIMDGKTISKNMVAAKTLKPPCHDCALTCTDVFTAEDRMNIFQLFCSLTDDEKNSFYFKFVTRLPVQRRRTKSETKIKQFTFKYFFEKNESLHQVCRTFFVNTIGIDRKRIYKYFSKFKTEISASPPARKQRKNAKPVRRSNSKKEEIDVNYLEKKLPSEYKSGFTNNNFIKDKDTEYILEEVASADEASVGDLEIPSYSKDESVTHYLDSPPLSEGEDDAFNNCYEPTSSEEEYILPHSEFTPSSKLKSSPSESGTLTKKSKIKNELSKCSRKRLGESATPYVSKRKKLVAAKTLKPPCNDCNFKCLKVFSVEDRIKINQSFWNMTDDEKARFYLKFVIRYPVQRRRSKSEANVKQFSFKYFLEKNESMFRVCHTFFLHTLCITSKRIYHFFANFKNKVAASAALARKRVTTVNKLTEVRERVSSQTNHKKLSADKFLLKESVSECGSDLSVANSEISDNEFEYILEEAVSAEEDEESVLPHSECPTSSERIPSESGLAKKRKRNADLWKCNIRKRLRESGKPYVSTNMKMIPAKTLKPPCHDCALTCTDVFTAEDRLNIFQSFWNMTDDEKSSFYLKFVTQNPVQRRRTKSEEIKKQHTFKYFFEKNEITYRVCRTFFVNTLCIDRKRIYYCFANLQVSGSPLPRKKGKNTKRVTAPYKLAEVREHISSIPTVDCRCCRPNTSRKFAEAGLNLNRMYNLYLENYEEPVGLHIYRRVFNNEFNISFQNPKKDQCDKCVNGFKNNKKYIKTETEQQHKAEKNSF